MQTPSPSTDVFLSHNSQDKDVVTEIAEQLQASDINVWLDTWRLRPGQRLQQGLADGIERSQAVAVFIGADGLGPWQGPEMEAFLDRAMREHNFPVIPVFLPAAPAEVELPHFLRIYRWVDMRNGITPEAMELLRWGIKEPDTPIDPKLPLDPIKESLSFRLKYFPDWVRWLVALMLIVVLASLLIMRLPPQPQPNLPDLYHLRVLPLDPSGNPVSRTTVSISAGHEPQQLADGWWEVEIPAAKLPIDRSISIWAKSYGWSPGRQELQLAEDPNPWVEIRLNEPQSQLQGVVKDRSGKTVADASVISTNGFAVAVTTDNNGQFSIQLKEPEGRRIRLQAENHFGLTTQTYCYTGREGCVLVLDGQ